MLAFAASSMAGISAATRLDRSSLIFPRAFLCDRHGFLSEAEARIRNIVGVLRTAPSRYQRYGFYQVPVVFPQLPIHTAFAEIVGPMFKRMDVNQEQSRTIASLRDALLPKLMSATCESATQTKW
jgi:hypothetical protein